MCSIISLLVFVAAFWSGLYLLVRRRRDRRSWPVISALLSIAAVQMCALMAMTDNLESMADIWRHGILLIKPVFLLSYVTIPLVSFPKYKLPFVQRLVVLGSYLIVIVLAIVDIGAIRHSGMDTSAKGVWNAVNRRIGVIHLTSEAVVIFLVLLCAMLCRHRDSSLNDMLVYAEIATIGGMGFVSITPLFSLLPSELVRILTVLLPLLTVVTLGYGVICLRPLLRHSYWVRQQMPLVGNSLELVLYVSASSALMWWLVRNHILKSPLLVGLAVAFLGVGVLEALRLGVFGPYIGQLLPRNASDYRQMSHTILRSLEGQDVSHMMQIVLDRLCQRFDVSKGFIGVEDDQRGFRIEAVYNMPSMSTGDCFELPAMTTRSLNPKTECAYLGDMILLIPLATESRQYGLLALGERPIGDFSKIEVELFTTLAYQLSVAIENLQLKRQISDELADVADMSEQVLHYQALLRESLRSTFGSLEATRLQSSQQARVYCLGEFEVHLERGKIQDKDWGGKSSGHRHAKALFAYLVVNRERTVRRDELIDVIWGASSDVRVLENRLDRTMSALRRALEPSLRVGGTSDYILTSVNGYRLSPTISWWIDTEEFSALLQEAERLERAEDAQGELAKRLEAEQLNRGEFMIDCAFLDRSHLVTTKREALQQQHQLNMICIGRLYQRLGSIEKGIAYLQQVALEDEFNEEAYRELVGAYYAADRYAEALQVCGTHRSILSEAGLPCSGTCLPLEDRGMG